MTQKYRGRVYVDNQVVNSGQTVAGGQTVTGGQTITGTISQGGNTLVRKTKQISISTTPTGAEQDTSFDLPVKGIVHNVYVNVTTAETTGTTKTLDIGLKAAESGGDADGFLDGIDVSSTGVKKGVLTAGGVTLGALFRETVTDSNTDTLNAKTDHIMNGTAKSVVYTAGSNNFAEFRGTIVIDYTDLD